jgi:ABC-type enterochelin transport system permease subunit
MAEWIKWWKDKTFLTVLVIIAITMLVSFLVAFFSCGWTLSVVIACLGGLGIRKVIIKRLDEESKNDLNVDK